MSRASSGSLTGSSSTNLHHLSDKDLRSCVTIIEDAFLHRSAPELALQLSRKFRMASYNLTIFCYAHRLYLNILSPSDIRSRFDQLPDSNVHGRINKKQLTNTLQRITIKFIHDDKQSNTIDEQKKLNRSFLSRTFNDDSLISMISILFKISHLFRIDSCNLLYSNFHNNEWNILKRILSYPSSSFPTKIKLTENFSEQLKLSNQQLVELIVNETDNTLQRNENNDSNDDYHCWPFDPNNIESYKQFILILYEKNYDTIMLKGQNCMKINFLL